MSKRVHNKTGRDLTVGGKALRNNAWVGFTDKEWERVLAGNKTYARWVEKELFVVEEGPSNDEDQGNGGEGEGDGGEQLSRDQLVERAKELGVSHPKNASAEKIRDLIKQAEDDGAGA